MERLGGCSVPAFLTVPQLAMLMLRIICAACHGIVAATSWMSSRRLSFHPAEELPMTPQIDYRNMSERFWSCVAHERWRLPTSSNDSFLPRVSAL